MVMIPSPGRTKKKQYCLFSGGKKKKKKKKKKKIHKAECCLIPFPEGRKSLFPVTLLPKQPQQQQPPVPSSTAPQLDGGDPFLCQHGNLFL